MADREDRRELTGRVEINDAYLGGKVGRGSENKVAFVAAVQANETGHPLFVRFDPVATSSVREIDRWGNRFLSAEIVAVSGGLHCFATLAPLVTDHRAEIVGSGKRTARHPSFRWASTLLGNLKHALSGTCHASSLPNRSSLSGRACLSLQPPIRSEGAHASPDFRLRSC